MSEKYTTGDVLEVKIDRIVPGGHGLAFAPRLTLLIDLAAVGDVLKVRLREVKKRLAWADIVEIVSPGPSRQVPPCIYFGMCGGCDFQQMAYGAQLEAKVAIIRDSLHRIGKIDWQNDIPIAASPRDLNYRSRARWHFDAGMQKFGYRRANSHELVDIVECPILTEPAQNVFARVRQEMPTEPRGTGVSDIEAAVGDHGGESILDRDGIFPPAEIAFSVNGFSYAYSAAAFFQGNQYLLPKMLELATAGLSGGSVLDLYSGVGLFSLPLSRSFEQVVAVEGNPAAVHFARKNAASFENVTIVESRVDRFLKSDHGLKPDAIILDPPRSGTERDTIPQIIKLAPRSISYISCDPSMLARDLRMLLDGGYDIRSIDAVDLFPQTHHIETIVRLELR